MNRQQLRTALAQATTSTFEELALLLADPSDADADADADPSCPDGASRPPCGVRVDFAGPWSGSLVVRVGEAALDGAAANMLGIAAAPDLPARRDALGELANVICGNLLPAIAGRTAVFALQAPRWIGAGDAARAGADACIACAIAVEGDRVHVELHLPARLVADAAAPQAVAP